MYTLINTIIPDINQKLKKPDQYQESFEAMQQLLADQQALIEKLQEGANENA